MKISLFLSFLFSILIVVAQTPQPMELHQNIPEVRFEKDFDIKYRQALNRIRRVYPLALQAKLYLDEFEADLENIEKKRKRKKYSKAAHQKLKDEFLYDIRDLYISEGIMLMKLVHRETQMSVSEIISKYRGNFQANVLESVGKIWDQNLAIEYEPFGDDWITELVISDIINKKIEFNYEIKPLDKETFKETQKEYREKRREYKKIKRKTKRAGSKDNQKKEDD